MELKSKKSQEASKNNFLQRVCVFLPILLITGLIGVLLYRYHTKLSWLGVSSGFEGKFFVFFLIGFFAQLVDGALGMGYGVTSTSFLLMMGVPPAMSSTAVHLAEMFTTGASAISHFKFGNINKKLLKNLLIPGVLGAILGAYLLVDVVDGEVIKPFIAVYMMILAYAIIRKAVRKKIVKRKTKYLGLLGAFGGFMDSIGGGGWGPIVTSTLLGNGRSPKYTIGSVNAAEFAVAFASGTTFLILGGVDGWQIIAGLILGGIIAAPLAAFLLNKINRKPMMVAVGVLIMLLSARTLYNVFAS